MERSVVKRAGVWALVLLGVACGENGEDPTGAVQGRVQSTTDPVAGIVSERTPGTAFGTASGAVTAAVGEFTGAGTFSTMASANVTADAPFLVHGVVAGRARLVAEVRAEGGAAVGRSILHHAVETGAVTTVAPVTVRTTAQANVYARLRARGRSPSDVATTELAARVAFSSEAEAAAATGSAAVLDALADAYEAAQATFEDALTRAGAAAQAGAAARQALGADVAAGWAVALHTGAERLAAERAYLDGLATAYVDGGIPARVQSEAGSAAAVAAFRATGRPEARLAVLRGSARTMAAARALLATDGLARLGATASAQAVTQARVQLDAQLDAAATSQAVLDAYDAFRVNVTAALRQAAQANLSVAPAAFDAFLDALAATDHRATLQAALVGTSDPAATAEAYAAFYLGMRQAVVTGLAPLGVGTTHAEAAADVIIAADAALNAGI